jgi:hypothetical protein
MGVMVRYKKFSAEDVYPGLIGLGSHRKLSLKGEQEFFQVLKKYPVHVPNDVPSMLLQYDRDPQRDKWLEETAVLIKARGEAPYGLLLKALNSLIEHKRNITDYDDLSEIDDFMEAVIREMKNARGVFEKWWDDTYGEYSEMQEERTAVRLFDDTTDSFKRTTPPSWKTPMKPVVDIIPNLPSTTDQEDRFEEHKKRLKPIQYKSKDSPDRGVSYHEVYPVTMGGPKASEAEMAGQLFPFLNSKKQRFDLDRRPIKPKLRMQLDYGVPERRD